MGLQEKEVEVSALRERFVASPAAFVVDFTRCTCEDLTNLREQLATSGAKMKVVKNTLARRAVVDSAASDLSAMFQGPTAVIWAGEDPVAPAKVLKDFGKDKEGFSVKGGVVDGQVVDQKGVASLAALPSKKEIIAQLLALINAPATRLLQTINAPASSLARLLGAWKSELEKKEGQQ